MLPGTGTGGRRRTQAGFALVAVIWVLVVAGLLLMGFNKQVRVHLYASRNAVEAVRARWLARAGAASAMAALADDDNGFDGPTDWWYDDPDTLGPIAMTGGTFMLLSPPEGPDEQTTVRAGLVDQAGLLNLNTASAEALSALCDLTPEQVDGILDWRDQDNRPRANGAEGPFYDSLDLPYLIRNGPLQTVGELRLVREIDDLAYFGEDANLDGLLEPNENDLSARLPDDDGDGVLRRGLGGLTTVWSYEPNVDARGQARVNLNTVDKQTLMVRFNFTDALAQAVVSRGGGSSRQGGASAQTGGQGGGPQQQGGQNPPGEPQGRQDQANQGQTPQGQSGQGQASQGSEQGQASQGQGQRAAARFARVMDLLDVRAGGNAKPDEGDKVNQITMEWIGQHIDELTLTDDKRLPGRVNVNTAPPEVLASLPSMTPAAAMKIVQRRGSGAGPYDSVGRLLGEAMDEATFKACAELLSVCSNVFEIRSRGLTDLGIRCDLTAVVDRGDGEMKVLYWYEGE